MDKRKGVVLVIRLRAENGLAATTWHGVRALLKRMLRGYGLRCIELRQEHDHAAD